MAVTFKDIATQAGVSYSTVSRVINDHPAVSPDAAAAVKRVMKELGYKPPPPERRRGPMRGAPRKDLTGTIALLFPDSDERAVRTPLSAALTNGIEDYLYEQRISLMITHLRDDDRLPICLEKRQVDGLIVRGGELNTTQANRLRSFPSVWLFQSARRIDWADQVMPDNDAVGELALRYIKEQKADRIAVYSSWPSHNSFRARIRAFEVAASDAGMACRACLNQEGEEALSTLQKALKSKSPPRGIFCPGDATEIAEICTLIREVGLEPMRDVTVIGCANDVSLLRSIHPDLPNIDIQPEAIGRTAAERLLWRLDNPKEPTQRLLIAPRLDLTPTR